MAKQLMSLRVSDLTRRQMTELANKLGMTLTEVVGVAIDRFYGREIVENKMWRIVGEPGEGIEPGVMVQVPGIRRLTVGRVDRINRDGSVTVEYHDPTEAPGSWSYQRFDPAGLWRVEEKHLTIRNEWGREIDYEAAVALMDDDIREQMASEGEWPEGESFFNEYARRHLARFGQEFEPAKRNPVW
jgi:hypothetical protein